MNPGDPQGKMAIGCIAGLRENGLPLPLGSWFPSRSDGHAIAIGALAELPNEGAR